MSNVNQQQRGPVASPLRSALRKCYGPLAAAGLFSLLINILALTGSVYMLQVYDRVLPSGSVPTLVVLTIVVMGLFAFSGLLDWIRQRLLLRIGNRFDSLLSDRVLALQLELPLTGGPDGNKLQPINDLDTIRGFFSGTGPSSFLDLPWMPFYLLFIFLLHPWLGILATVGALISVAITLTAEGLSRQPARNAMESVAARRIFSDAARRNAEVVKAMGLTDRMGGKWAQHSARYLTDQQRISDVVSGSGSISRTFRMALQSLILGLGAYVVLRGEASGGIIIASSILTARALAPIDGVIGNWRQWIATRQSWRKLDTLLARYPAKPEALALPRPTNALQVEALAVCAPGTTRPIVQNVNLKLEAGQGLGIIGPSASGKSSLVRGIVGAWVPAYGKVRFDGAASEQFDPAALGRDIGYLPQDIELFDGTVAENISRFDPDAAPEAILKAAEEAGVHQIILRLPQGYQTRVAEGGVALSAGQRQLVGLARALYGEPFLVVLDEPNSNLDSDGDMALSNAIAAVRRRNGVVIVVAHRPSAIVNVDLLLFMNNGQVGAFGPRDKVLAQISAPRQQPQPAAAGAQQPHAGAPNGEAQRSPTVVPLHDHMRAAPPAGAPRPKPTDA